LKNNQNTQKILLDTSFLLPTLGVEVEQEVTGTLSKIDSERIHLFYSDWSLLESSWIAIRQIKQGMYQAHLFRRGLLSITKTEVYQPILASPDDYLNALDLYQRGHPDMIDNLLYVTALRNQYRFLTIDDEFMDFISKNNIEDIVLTPKDF
jgi:predicted nucleic acid-binding protein